MENSNDHIIYYLQKLEKVGVAFSGGVDSSLLAVLAEKALGKNAFIFTIITPYMVQAEIASAIRFAKKHHLNHHLINMSTPGAILNNPQNRCYLCKQELFSQVLKQCETLEIPHIIDGSNADDLNDYRPGMQALKELQIKSPFLELGITKREVRAISKDLKLETWDSPSNPCLLTRLPYNKEISTNILWQVEKAEEYLHKEGFRTVRVRHQGDNARIEVPAEDRTLILENSLSEKIVEFFRSIGYAFVSVDLKGFSSGNMNQTL